jgi:hypothetical protein
MELDLSSGYLKMFLDKKRTLIAHRVEKGKMVKTFEDHNFLLETNNWENKLSMERL